MKSLQLLLTLQLLLLPLICITTSHNTAVGRSEELQEFKPSELASIKDAKRRTAVAAAAETPIQRAENNPTTTYKSRRVHSLGIANNSRLKRRIIHRIEPKLTPTLSSKTVTPKGRPRLLRRVTKITPLGKRQIESRAPPSLTNISKSTSDGHVWLNRTYKAQLMKQRYFKFRSLLPGGEVNKEGHSSKEEVRTSVVAEAESSSLVTRLQDISRGNIRRVSSIVLKEQRSAGENTGSTISGQLKKFHQPFVASDVHLQLNSDSNISPEHSSSNSSSVESITRLLAKRLGPSARNTYDPSILVDFLALVALNRQPTSIRQTPDEIPGTLLSSRRRGGDLPRRLSQRRAGLGLSNATTEYAATSEVWSAQAKELGPRTATASHQHDRATSSLEAPLLFSTSDLSSQNESTRDGDSAQTKQRQNLNTASSTTTESLSNPLNGARGSNEFGPFSDGNDASAGVSPPALPPVLKASLYNYLVPRLMYLAPLTETIPGVPGLDYPIMSTVPYTNFYCTNMPWPGFYADTEARCQAWHMCDLDGRQASFLCPNGTIFNQAFMVCDWWYNSDCQAAPYLYPLNERLFQQPELPPPTQQHRTLTAQVLDTLFL